MSASGAPRATAAAADRLPGHDARGRVVVTGGAGFVGSHLCRALVGRGDDVVCVDDFSSGSPDNVADLAGFGPGRFTMVEADVSEVLPVDGPVTAVAHLASPASPPEYLARPLQTLAVGSRGTELALALAGRHQARFLLASTSEVYGDPLQHPQTEEYWGNVNPIGPRSVYDEAKRFAEALTMAHRRLGIVDTVVVRIFNTYGPALRAGDGRVVSNFLSQALEERPLTVFGDGSQTRSLCYVDDTVTGLLAALDSTEGGPFNIGNPAEITVAELARHIQDLTGSTSGIEHHSLPVDDPTRRCPDIDKARRLLGWEPVVGLDDGLRRTATWMRQYLGGHSR